MKLLAWVFCGVLLLTGVASFGAPVYRAGDKVSSARSIWHGELSAGYVQTFIQKVSYQIYHDIPTDCPSLTNSLWSKLPLEDISDAEKITLDNISFFIYDEKAIKRRKSIILNVINALQQRISGKIISSKVVSDRYTSGLNSLSSNNLIDLKNDLENYISQLSQI